MKHFIYIPSNYVDVEGRPRYGAFLLKAADKKQAQKMIRDAFDKMHIFEVRMKDIKTLRETLNGNDMVSLE